MSDVECLIAWGGKIGFVWPFDFAQGRAELEFWLGIGFDWVCFE